MAGRVEGDEDPVDAASREIMEETGIAVSEPDARLDPVYVREGNVLWKVHPFLYRVGSVEPVLNEENEAFDWVAPEDMAVRDTVDGTVGVVQRLLSK